MELPEIKRFAFRRLFGAVVILGTVFFVSAGTISYWQAWVYLAVLLPPMALVMHYLIRNDPELLERRLTGREKREKQDVISKVTAVLWLMSFLIPGLDQRLGWSSVPWLVVVISDGLVLSGYLLFFLVLKENSYASKTVEVQECQTVITTGPYALVRHPMYLAILTMLVFSPLALGSFWAVIPTLFTPVILVFRIRDEEEMLLKELSGYREYGQRTPNRLIPGIW